MPKRKRSSSSQLLAAVDLPSRRSVRLSKATAVARRTTLGIASKSRVQVEVLISSSIPCKSIGQTLNEPLEQHRRSIRLSEADLSKREQSLLAKEEDYERRLAELDARTNSVNKLETKASTMMSQLKTQRARSILSQLEDYFTCPLCYEVMAHPFTLNPGQCGHSFCALCILKWFFSRLHKACGGWHESVDCPICRSLLIITPERTPRTDITFPFVPNRTAASACEALVQELSISTMAFECSQSSTRKNGNRKKRKLNPDVDPENTDIVNWQEGGSTRIEWLKKDSEGKTEMSYLLNNWGTLRSPDFIALKQRLGV